MKTRRNITMAFCIGIFMTWLAYHQLTLDPIDYSVIPLSRIEKGWESPVMWAGDVIWICSLIFANALNETEK